MLSFNIVNKSTLGDHVKPLLLLISVSAYVFAAPLVHTSISSPVNFVLILVILGQTAFVLGEKRKKFLALVLMVWIIAVVSKIANLSILNYTSRFTTNLFFIYVVFRLIGEIMKTKAVSSITILEAINGYLLLGIAYSGFVDFTLLVDPSSFHPQLTSLHDIKYFTFVTFASLGYGDVIPISPIAKSLSLIITISGQFYVGVIVAILVGKYASQ